MTYELKPRRHKSSWDVHPPMRNMKSAKRFEGKKASMTVLGDGDRQPKYPPYPEYITKFLRSLVGKTINEAYSKFIQVIGHRELGFNPHKVWHTLIQKGVTRYMYKGWFYEDENGILREFGGRKRNKTPKLTDKQRKYNRDNFIGPSPDIYNTMGVGPYSLKTKAWVEVKGQIMLLPIYLIDMNVRNGLNTSLSGKADIVKKQRNLQQFIPVAIEYTEGSLITFHIEKSDLYGVGTLRSIVSAVRIGDIESYKKEKFYEK